MNRSSRLLPAIGLALLTLITLVTISRAQQMPCCDTRNNFASFVEDADFAALHPSPLPFAFVPSSGKDITFQVEGGPNGKAYEVVSPKPSDRVLIVVHEYWGLNGYIKEQAEGLQKQLGNVTVIAVDLYDGKVGTTPEEAGALVKAVKPDRIEAILKGAIHHAGSKAKIATIGWCFGGGWALRASIMAGKQGIGTVMYYGDPVLDPKELRSLNGPVLGLFAKQDGWIDTTRVKSFQGAMKQASKSIEVHEYDANHGFANPSNPHHDVAATADANAKALEFLKKHLMAQK